MHRLILDYAAMALAVGWLLLVGCTYASLFLFSEPPPGPYLAPSPPDLSRVSLAPLAALLILGIIRRFARSRRSSPGGAEA
jgi:hypothetical protein